MSNYLPILNVKKLTPSAVIPSKANKTDAGYDLVATESVHLSAGERKVVSTGICMAIPEGWYGRIAGRSGLALKSGITVLGGVIDSGYRGEIKVILLNTQQYSSVLDRGDFEVNQGDKIAQIIFEQCGSFDLQDVGSEELNTSERGANGFGSSDRNMGVREKDRASYITIPNADKKTGVSLVELKAMVNRLEHENAPKHNIEDPCLQ
jgi:dUTP pyrophosphatase